jgi:Acyltransferase family
MHYTASNALLHLTFLFGLLPRDSFSTFLPDWSLGLEMQFYVAFPLIFLSFRRLGPARAAVVFAVLSWAAVVVLRHAGWHGWIDWPYREPSLLFLRLPVFLAGSLIFMAADRRSPAYAALALALCTTRAEDYGFGVLWLISAAAAIAMLAMRPVASVERACGRGVILFASDVSYSVYLLHGFVLALIGSHVAQVLLATGWPPPAIAATVWATVMPLTYALAAVTYRWIERPGIAFGKRLIVRDGFQWPDVSRWGGNSAIRQVRAFFEHRGTSRFAEIREELRTIEHRADGVLQAGAPAAIRQDLDTSEHFFLANCGRVQHLFRLRGDPGSHLRHQRAAHHDGENIRIEYEHQSNLGGSRPGSRGGISKSSASTKSAKRARMRS